MRRCCGKCAERVDKFTLAVHSASGRKIEDKTIQDCCMVFLCPVKEEQTGCARWKDVGNLIVMGDE